VVAAADRAGGEAVVAEVGVVSDTQLLWKVRRRVVKQLEHSPAEKRAALRAAMRGIDALLRAVFENRKGGRNVGRN
jgi:hypothetical protein